LIGHDFYPWQKAMVDSDAKIKWVQAGRRAGKTRSSLMQAMKIIELAATTPVVFGDSNEKLTAKQARLVPEIHVWTVAPTRAQMLQVWNEMQTFIPEDLVRKTRRKGQAGGRGGGFKQDDLHVWLDLKTSSDSTDGLYRTEVFWELKSADNPESLQTVGLDLLKKVRGTR